MQPCYANPSGLFGLLARRFASNKSEPDPIGMKRLGSRRLGRHGPLYPAQFDLE